jgi:hypothetical protein
LGNDILGKLVFDAIEAYIATLTDAEKKDWNSIRREKLQKEIYNPVEDFINPIGSIIAWHKNFSGVPSLPDNYAECNGQVISDSESPLNGETLPDLNGDERFLRGGSLSGTLQADAFQGHRHLSPISANNGFFNVWGQTFGQAPKEPSTSNTEGDEYFWHSSDPISDNTNGTPRTADETRPKNMSIVWIMRIK